MRSGRGTYVSEIEPDGIAASSGKLEVGDFVTRKLFFRQVAAMSDGTGSAQRLLWRHVLSDFDRLFFFSIIASSEKQGYR